ncbi:MAG: OadG family protein [Roseburia sp.]
MKKKLLALISVSLFALCLMACSKTDPRTYDYGENYSYEALQSYMQSLVSSLDVYSDEQIDSMLSQISEKEDPLDYNLGTSFKEARAGEGELVGFGDMDVTIANGTMTLEQEVIYENRSLIFTMVCDYDAMRSSDSSDMIQDVRIDKKYSKSEIMSKAGMNTLMGIGVVFCILILISLVIYCFRIIPYLTDRKKKKQESASVVSDQVVEQITKREEQLLDDLELVAVISAAIAAATGSSTDGFVVRSIKRR